MKVHSKNKSSRRGRGRPRKCSTANRSKVDSDSEEVIVLDSSSESQPDVIISLLDTTDESIDAVVKLSRAMADMKDLRLVIKDLKHVPGALSAKHLEFLANRRSVHEENEKRSNEGKILKIKKEPKDKPVKKALFNLSSTTSSESCLDRQTPKKAKRRSHKAKPKPIKEEVSSDIEIIPRRFSTHAVPSFGENSPSGSVISQNEDKRNRNAKKSKYVPSIVSMSSCSSTSTTKKRNSRDSDREIHPFFTDIQESIQRQKEKKAEKRRKRNADLKIQKFREQSQGQISVNGKFSSSEDLLQKSIDRSNGSKKEVAESLKVTETPVDLSGKRSIESIKESIVALPSVAGEATIVNDTEQRNADSCPTVNGDLRDEDFSDLQPFLDCNVNVKITDRESNANKPPTFISASDTNAHHALDKENVTLDSISEAIDNDLAAGNRLLQIGEIDNTELINLLPLSSMSDHEETQPAVSKNRVDTDKSNEPPKNHESLNTCSTSGDITLELSNGNGSVDNDRKRKRLKIIQDDVLPKGTTNVAPMSLETIRQNRKRKKLNQPVEAPVPTVDNNNCDLNDDLDIDNEPTNSLSPIHDWEIEEILNETSSNNNCPASVKDGKISQDALNNNDINKSQITVMNKNDVNSEKPPNSITMYALQPATSQVILDSDSTKDFQALQCLLDEMNADGLNKAIADDEAPSELGSIDGREIDEALEQFTNTVAINVSAQPSKEAEIVEAPQIESLTVQNLDKFNSRVALVEVERKTTNQLRRNTVDTDAFSHKTDGTTDSKKNRKRKWVNADEKQITSPLSCSKIKLNRRSYGSASRDSKEKIDAMDHTAHEVEQPIDYSIGSKASFAKSTKNDDKKIGIGKSVIDETVSVINEYARKLLSPIKSVQGCGTGIGGIVPGFGDLGIMQQNPATSTPMKSGVAPTIGSSSGESSKSSSSDSSSNSSSSSSSSSSDEDSSDESEDGETDNSAAKEKELDEVETVKERELKIEVAKESETQVEAAKVSEQPQIATQNGLPEIVATKKGESTLITTTKGDHVSASEAGSEHKAILKKEIVHEVKEANTIGENLVKTTEAIVHQVEFPKKKKPPILATNTGEDQIESPTKRKFELEAAKKSKSTVGPRKKSKPAAARQIDDTEPSRSDSGIKMSSQTSPPTLAEENAASFGAEALALSIEKAAGSFNVDSNDQAELDVDDDKSDAISLYTESLCMSRAGSPERQEPSRKRAAPAVSPKKQLKPSNVRSRLGPRIDPKGKPRMSVASRTPSLASEHDLRPATNDAASIGKAPSVSIVNVESVANSILGRLNAPNFIQINPGTSTPSILPARPPNGLTAREIEMLFRGLCFAWLRTGVCKSGDLCRYQHDLPWPLRSNLTTPNATLILTYAIACRYGYFIEIVQKAVMLKMTARHIIQFCIDISRGRILTDAHFLNVIEALKEHGLTLGEIVNLFDVTIESNDVENAMRIIESLFKLLEPGTCWETMKKLLSKYAMENISLYIVVAVLDECVHLHRNKSHVDDVYDNFVVRLPNDTILALNRTLLRSFYDLRNGTVVAEVEEPPVEVPKKSNWTCSIASPDSPRESLDGPFVAQPDDPASISSPARAQQQTSRGCPRPSMSSGGESQSSTRNTNSYIIKPLNKLPEPKSAYADTIWRFHLDLKSVQDGLKHKDYDLVIKTLSENQNHPNRLPHIAGFYSILCKEIMSSRHHFEEIVRRTVQSGASDELRRYVYDLGVYVLTTLADTGVWVIAYDLLKTFKVYGQYNTCAFTLLSAEIYIANHRPLKALAVLKQSQLVFTNTKRWNQLWCPEDEPLRVSVMELLLGSLCYENSEYALSLLEFILGDQCNSIKPINVGRYLDRLANVLLEENRTSAVVDLGRLILQNNLLVSPKVFRALINRVFHCDQFLAKQLHRYATWLGTYNMPKISGITHMIVNVDWTEEEMFLMFSSLLHELYVNIGHAIGRLRPRQLAVYLILETLPGEQQLLTDLSEPPLSNAEIQKRRAAVVNVFKRFDPKIKVIRKAQGTLCKIQSESLVDYLKAGHFNSELDRR